MRDREKMRYVFPCGERFLVKYKLISKTVAVPDTVYDAAMLDLSEEGARFQGDLNEKFIYELGTGAIQIGCNIYLNDKMIKVLANARWFKAISPGEYEFGLQFNLGEESQLEIQRFLIRHQIDTRRFKRKPAST